MFTIVGSLRRARILGRADAVVEALCRVVPSREKSRRVTARAPEDDPAGARTAVGPTEPAMALGGPHDPGDRSAPPYDRLRRCRVRRLIGTRPTSGCRRVPEKCGVYSQALTQKLVPKSQVPCRTI